MAYRFLDRQAKQICGPDDTVHVSDFRVHREITTRKRRISKPRTRTLDHGSPRLALWITGIDQPGSVATENGEGGIERVAHRPLEVVGALNSPVDPVHTFQKPEMGSVLFVGVFALGFYWNFTRLVSLAHFDERGTNRDVGILVRTDI
jgi:hypothetical protein